MTSGDFVLRLGFRNSLYNNSALALSSQHGECCGERLISSLRRRQTRCHAILHGPTASDNASVFFFASSRYRAVDRSKENPCTMTVCPALTHQFGAIKWTWAFPFHPRTQNDPLLEMNRG